MTGEHGTVGRRSEKTADGNHEMEDASAPRMRGTVGRTGSGAWWKEMSANTWAVESDSCEFVTRGGSHWTEAAGRSDAVTQ